MSESHPAPVPPPTIPGSEPPDEPLEIVFADQLEKGQTPAPARPDPATAQGSPAGDPLRDAAAEPCTRNCTDETG